MAWSGDGVDDAGVDNNSSTSKTAEVGLPWGSSYTKVPQPRFNKEFVHVAVECDAPPLPPSTPAIVLRSGRSADLKRKREG